MTTTHYVRTLFVALLAFHTDGETTGSTTPRINTNLKRRLSTSQSLLASTCPTDDDDNGPRLHKREFARSLSNFEERLKEAKAPKVSPGSPTCQSFRDAQRAAIDRLRLGMDLDFSEGRTFQERPHWMEFVHDYDVMLEAVTRHGGALKWAVPALQANRTLVLAALKQNGRAFKFARLSKDADLLLEVASQPGIVLNTKALENKMPRCSIPDMEPVLTRNGRAFLYACPQLRGYCEFARHAMKSYGNALRWASRECQGDKSVVLEAVHQNGMALQFASQTLQNDQEVVLKAVGQTARALCCSGMELRHDPEFMLKAVNQTGGALKYLSEELKANKAFVLAAVQQNPSALEFSSERLRHDREVVLEAVRQNGAMLQHASHELQEDSLVVFEAVRQTSSAFLYAAPSLRKHKDIVLEAVKQDGLALRNAPAELQADPKVVLEAVKQAGLALGYADAALQANRTIVLEAVRNHGGAFEHASSDLQEDREVQLAAIKSVPTAEDCAKVLHSQLLKDHEFVVEATRNSKCRMEVLEKASPENLLCESAIAIDIVKKDGLALSILCADLRASDEVAFTAVQQNVDALGYASETLQHDWKFIAIAAAQGKAKQYSDSCKGTSKYHGNFSSAEKALQGDGLLLACLDVNLIEGIAMDKAEALYKLTLTAVSSNAMALRYASKNLQADARIVLVAVSKAGESLQFATAFRADKYIVKAAVRNNGCALEFASPRLKGNREIVEQAWSNTGMALGFVSGDFQCTETADMVVRKPAPWIWALNRLNRKGEWDEEHCHNARNFTAKGKEQGLITDVETLRCLAMLKWNLPAQAPSCKGGGWSLVWMLARGFWVKLVSLCTAIGTCMVAFVACLCGGEDSNCDADGKANCCANCCVECGCRCCCQAWECGVQRKEWCLVCCATIGLRRSTLRTWGCVKYFGMEHWMQGEDDLHDLEELRMPMFKRMRSD